jgi:hypothetical protein
MGTLREAAESREFASRWQIVDHRRLSHSDSTRMPPAFFCSFSAFYQVFSSFGREARLNDAVVYASLNRRSRREARQTRRPAYTTFGKR